MVRYNTNCVTIHIKRNVLSHAYCKDRWISCRHIFTVMKFLNIRHIPSSLIMKIWYKDTKSKSPLLLPQPSNNQIKLFKMSRYGSLNSGAQMMNYYPSKVESSYKIAKDEIAHLTTMFKDAFQVNSSTINPNQVTLGMFCTNPNIIRTLLL